jgi:hypothetical protein
LLATSLGQKRDNPDKDIYIDEWYASVVDDGGGKLATVVGRGQEKVGTGNRESGRGKEEGSRGSCRNVEDGKDLSICNSELIKIHLV